MDGRLARRLQSWPSLTKRNRMKSTFSFRGSLRLWPLEYHQRDSLTRKVELQGCTSAFRAGTGRRVDGRKMSRLLQLLILVRRWLGGRAHFLPDRVRVAVVGVDSVVCELGLANRRGQPLKRQVDFRFGPRQIVVVIVPNHDAELVGLGI